MTVGGGRLPTPILAPFVFAFLTAWTAKRENPDPPAVFWKSALLQINLPSGGDGWTTFYRRHLLLVGPRGSRTKKRPCVAPQKRENTQ